MIKKYISTGVFVVALVATAVSVSQYRAFSKSSASFIKKSTAVNVTDSLSKVSYNGEDMYVAKSTFYDYYSDSEVGTGATPNEIKNAKTASLNNFGQFNTKIMQLMKYNDASQCPAQYPLYQGKHGYTFTPSDMKNFYTYNDEAALEKSNYWLAANNGQIGSNATQGLVDNKLKYDSDGTSYITQSNPKNGKSANLPYFDNKFLTTNKFDNSQLTLGEVRDNVSFPFRKTQKDGVTYYEFNSSIDTVRFNNNKQLEYLGLKNKNEQVRDCLSNPGLFPYNNKSQENSDKLNFGYGLKIEVPFNMPKDGKVDGKDIVFEFSGDDDVWVFIDGELALDIGGAHKSVSGTINFAKKIATVSSVKNNKVVFAKRDMRLSSEGLYTNNELGLVNVPATFKNKQTSFSLDLKNKLNKTNEVHTLTFFYMERGMVESNMKINFNLPEPTKYTVDNVVISDNVSDAFKEEAIKVAKDDEFVFDVSDKTTSKSNSFFIKADDGVLFTNEFAEKDILLTQQRTLRNASRKMTDLYDTRWVLKDEQTEICKGNSLIVSDSRATDRGNILFANVSGKGVPVLTSTYTNSIKSYDFVLVNKVSDEYISKHSDYKDKEFKYTVKYQKVFGGSSEEKAYSGKYYLYKEDGSEEEKTTDNGEITIKPGQKVVIKSVPVLTLISTSVLLGEEDVVTSLKATDQFKCDCKKGTCEGTIGTSNVVEYTIGYKSEEVKTPEKMDDNEVKETVKNTDAEKNLSKDDKNVVQPTAPGQDELDETAKTGDETELSTWLVLMIISIAMTLGAGISLIIARKN